MSLEWNLSDAFLMIRLSLVVLGRKNHRDKIPFS